MGMVMIMRVVMQCALLNITVELEQKKGGLYPPVVVDVVVVVFAV